MKASQFLKKICAVVLSATVISGSAAAALPVLETDSGIVANAAESSLNEQKNSSFANVANNLSVSGTNGFGALLSSELDKETEEQQENAGNKIFSLEINNNTAAADFETTEGGTLVVGIYDEQGVKLITSANAEVESEQTEVTITFDEKLPEYFYVKAYLVDSDTLKPLCTVYESPNYTQEMQEFFAMTTDDFDDEKVLNLDDDKTNNFAVYGDDVKVIEGGVNKNVVVTDDSDNDRYVIKNIDSSISSLQKGDIFTYEYDTNDIIIVKIADITISNGTATITGEDTSLEEVFDYVKIDENSNESEPEVDTSTCDEDVQFNGLAKTTSSGPSVDVESTKKFTLSYSVDKKIEPKNQKEDDNLTASAKIKGGVDLGIGASIKVYITLKSQYIEFKTDYSVKVSVSISGKLEAKIPLGNVGFSPVFGIYVGFTPSIVFRAEAKIELSSKLSGGVGFKISNASGIENISSSPKLETSITIEGTVFVGINLVPKIKIISDKVAKVEAEAEVGAEAKATPFKATTKKNASVIHTCGYCLEGEFNGKLTLSVSAKLLNSKHLSWKLNLLDLKSKISDFYYSKDHNEFALGTCPYKEYKTTINVIDQSGKPISDAKISYMLINVQNKSNQATTSQENIENSPNSIYLNAGIYIFSVSASEYEQIKK